MTLAPPPPPPRVSDLPCGTLLVAGLGHAEVVSDVDVETYSEAGYLWSPEHVTPSGRLSASWRALPGGTGKPGLFYVGAHVYAEHPSTRVLTMSYNLKDGRGVRRWTPGQPPPADLVAYLAAGGKIESHNAGFERKLWNAVLVPQGFPPLDVSQQSCSMAKARAHGLPGALGKLQAVLGGEQKDKGGSALIDLFSKPRNPTAKDGRLRTLPSDEPERFAAFQDYCDQDIEAEADASARIPDLSPDEREFWELDQRANDRGVAVDLPSIHAAIAIMEEVLADADAELHALTDGAVARASETGKLADWLRTQGVSLPDMTEETVTQALADSVGRQGEPARRALEIRQAAGLASVKKLYQMRNCASSAGRLHDLYNYHGARTGRDTANGAQPTNMPNSGPRVRRCGPVCGRHYRADRATCPWCGEHAVGDPGEWTALAAADAIDVIRCESGALLADMMGSPLAVISACLRGMFVAADGHVLMSSDYTAIEAVVLAMLAGEQWRITLFEEGGKLYEASGARMTGERYEDLLEYKARTGEHHPTRKKGKVGELACMTADTQVLTDRGYLRIVDVKEADRLWDGVEWVRHFGLVEKGQREVLRLDGVGITPDHLVSLNGSWQEAGRLASHPLALFLSLANGSANLPWSGSTTAPTFSSSAAVSASPTTSPSPTWPAARRPDAPRAGELRAVPSASNTGNTPSGAQTTSTADGCSTVSQLASAGATTLETQDSRITGAAESACITRGALIGPSFSGTWSRFRAGTTRCLKWIGETLTAAMSPGTSGSSPIAPTKETAGQSSTCSSESSSLSSVYDIAHAGPRNRFTIKTDSGHLIVHNCGYGGWLGALKNFGADEWMSDNEIVELIKGWRKASPAIVEFWGGQYRGLPWVEPRQVEYFGLEGASIQAVLHPGQVFSAGRREVVLAGVPYLTPEITYQMHGDVLYCTLPSGRRIAYQRPRLRRNERDRWGESYALSFEGWNSNPKKGPIGWLRMDLYGGLQCENVCQAVARDVLRDAVVRLWKAGYPAVLRVYDEIASEVRVGHGSLEEFERLMAIMPAWATGWPIRASGGWTGHRYRK